MSADTDTVEDREFAQWRERLRQDVDGLLCGEDLKMAAHWLRVHSNDLSETERRLIRASIRQSEDDRSRTNRVLLFLFAALALIAAASAAAVWKWEQNQKDAKSLADRSRLQSARLLTATAASVFAKSPSLALLLALESRNISQESGALRSLLAHPAGKPLRDSDPFHVTTATISRDGAWIISGSPDGRLRS